MPILAVPAACFGCSACCAACPERAIVMTPDLRGFLYPAVDETKCTGCGACTEVCPVLHRNEHAANEEYYALRGTLDVRQKSTSGGAFQLLARAALSKGGIVFGAAFDEELHVQYCSAETEEELQKLLGTKYVQARPGPIMENVRTQLEQGREVLFCGDPCMVQGLKRYLEPYAGSAENLLLADHVCFGCPSEGFWERYLDHLQHLCGSPVEAFSFRDKRNPDSGHTVSFLAGGREYTQPFSQDPYLRLYNRSLSLRDSCMTCPYCTPVRDCDVTLGDFWGIEKIKPELDDGYGVSLVITHSEKGERALAEILPETEWIRTDAESAMQPRLQEPSKATLLRKLFVRDICRTGVDSADMAFILQKYGGG